ncbi:MAG TPA: chemotaxis protein CheW [Coleofasciculaceae cyanobacterium]
MSTSLSALSQGSGGSFQPDTLNLDLSTREPGSADASQQFLRFSVGHDTALLPLEQITEILQINVMTILPVPETSSCVWGVCNWQGKLLWLVDLDALLGYSPQLQQEPFFQQEPIVLMVMVVQLNQQTLGLGVQQVGDIEFHPLQKLQPPTPGLFPPKLQPFVLGALPECKGAVLNVTAIVQCPLWQTYPG